MSEIKRPNCLHVPALFSGSEVTLMWEDTGADFYEVDCVLDGDFEQAQTGLSWDDLDEAELSWAEHDAKAQSWAALEQQAAQGRSWNELEWQYGSWDDIEALGHSFDELRRLPVCHTFYSGRGDDAAGPGQGRSWQDWDEEAQSWDAFEAQTLAWIDIEQKPARGLCFGQWEGDALSWDDFEGLGDDAAGLTWREIECYPERGLCWNSADAHFKSWDELDDAQQSFDEWERQQPDNVNHRAVCFTVPLNAHCAMLRIRACMADGRKSSYLVTAQLGIIHESLLYQKLQKNMVYPVAALVQNAEELEGATFTLLYDSHHLRPQAHPPKAGGIRARPSILHSDSGEGELVFSCQPQIPAWQQWSGLCAQTSFTALCSGETLVRMQVVKC